MKKINGIPELGFGTYQLIEGCEKIVDLALSSGYTHIDTAQFYKNEDQVGAAIKNSSVAREDIWLTTKVWPSNLSKANFIPSVEESLKNLKSDYVDLLLIHWPNNDVALEESLDGLIKSKELGYAKEIGVSNYNSDWVEKTIAYGAPIITNQVEYHPMLDQSKLKSTLDKNNIALTAYCPLGQGKIVSSEVAKDIGAKYNKSAAQVCLRWHIQQANVITIPKTKTPSRVEENMAVFDFELNQSEMEAISGLAQKDGRVVAPPRLNDYWD